MQEQMNSTRQRIAARCMESIRSSGKRFLEYNFSTFDSPRDVPQRISSDDVQRNREAALADPKVKTSLTSEHGHILWHNSNADICVKTVDCEFYNTGGITAELRGRTAKTAHVGTAFRQVYQSIIILGVENNIQNTGLKWF